LSRYRPLCRLALIGALAAALGLAACGRKGPLDPPPGASLAGEPQANLPGLMSSKGQTPPAANSGAAQAPKKHFPLDVLLN
jgi:predicted small lipoprotein YifL